MPPGRSRRRWIKFEPAGVEIGEAVEGAGAVYDLLKQAALFDYRGDLAPAFKTYWRFLEAHRNLSMTGGQAEEAVPEELRRGAVESLNRLNQRVQERLSGLEGKFSRRVFLLLAAVQDYASPLVPDLVGPEGDLQAWELMLGGSPIGGLIEVRRIDTSSRPQFLRTLGESLEEAGPDDLVFFIFSGRGLEVEGKRYLAPASALVEAESGIFRTGAADVLAGPLGRATGELSDTSGTRRISNLSNIARSVDSGPRAELVDIAEIAELAADRWFVGVYDTQFSKPIFDAGRPDAILDKHLHSVRPSSDQTPSVASGFSRFAAGGANALAKQVHVWWEGSLTERLVAPPGCDADPVKDSHSPMTAALLGTLLDQPHATYREWIDLAQEHPCLGSSPSFGFVAQGSIDLPRFASGNAATQIPYFLSERERRDLNLHAADRVTEIASQSGDHPLFVLSRAAILVGLTEFARSSPSEEEHEQSDWLEEALDLLRPLLQSAEVQEYSLEGEALDLFTRALVLNGDDDQARNHLLDALPSQLTSATLQKRLLDLTEAELRQSPTGILEAAREKLAELKAGGLDTGVSTDLTARTRGAVVFLRRAARSISHRHIRRFIAMMSPM